MLKKYFTLSFLVAVMLSVQAQIAVKADTVFTMAGTPLVNGVVLVKDGKIEAVGSNLAIPAGYKTYTAKVATPGLIDARSVVGLAGAYNVPSDQDQLERSSPLQPELRAIDAYNPDEKLVAFLREHGITTLHTGHGWGALMSGQTMVVKTKKGQSDDVTIQPVAMMAMTLGPSVSGYYSSPGNRSKEMAMLRTELLKAQTAMKKGSKDTAAAADLKQQMLQQLLRGETRALIAVNTATDILSAIRLAKEFNLKLVLEEVAEGYRVADQIKASGAGVIVHATMARAGGETLNMTMENAALLTRAGIPVSIESGYEAYVPKTRVVLYEAAVAMAKGGLPYEEALKTITINPAKLLGLDGRIGSLEKGKDADIVLFDGDPFEYTTKTCVVIIDGKVEAENCK